MRRKIRQIERISIVFTINSRDNDVNVPLKSVNRQYGLFLLCLISSKTAVNLMFASRQSATHGFTPIWKVNGVCKYVPLIVSRIISYATNVIYLLKSLKKTGNKVIGRKFEVCVFGTPGFRIYDTNPSLYAR